MKGYKHGLYYGADPGWVAHEFGSECFGCCSRWRWYVSCRRYARGSLLLIVRARVPANRRPLVALVAPTQTRIFNAALVVVFFPAAVAILSHLPRVPLPRDALGDCSEHDAAGRAAMGDARDRVLGLKVGLERHDDAGARGKNAVEEQLPVQVLNREAARGRAELDDGDGGRRLRRARCNALRLV